MSKYLDITGLAYFWEKAKTYISTIIPTKTSDLVNDRGYITTYVETDPTVPAWAKTINKPTYTAAEVNAVPITRTINGQSLESDIVINIPVPSSTSDLVNDSGFINSVAVSSSGSGNVVTGLSASGDTITYTLGNVSTNAAQIIRNNSTTDISTLKIHYLTQAEYETALANNQINENELYFTSEQ